MALCVGAYSFNAASQSSLVSSLMPFSFAASWAHCEHMAVRPLRSGCTPGLAPTKTLRSTAYGKLCALGPDLTSPVSRMALDSQPPLAQIVECIPESPVHASGVYSKEDHLFSQLGRKCEK